MRYCPHCRRINPGRPQFCHFCARTWHIRICNHGHENPADVQFCGACGSADLTETAGARPWLMILFKAGLWLLVGLLVYGLAAGLVDLLNPSAISHALPFFVTICLLAVGLKLALSVLPGFIGKGVRRLVGSIGRLLVKAVVWFLGKIWVILK